MPIPTIAPLPEAPSRSDGPAAFVALADPFIAALPPFALQMNVAVEWMAATMATVLDYKDAAAESAGSAADSAVLAGEQVGLAVTARQGAEAAQASTIALAAALMAGALPVFVDGLDVLQAKPDKSGVQWGKVGQAIGDVLETTRTPDATYLLPDTIYSRAAYPDLFAVVGTQGEKNDGANFSARDGKFTGGTAYNLAIGKNGVVIMVGGTTGANTATGSKATKSVDGGLTWAALPALDNLYTLRDIATDGNGVWIAIGMDSSSGVATYTSTDNGITWAQTSGVFGNTGGNLPYLRTDKLGNWLCGHTGGVAYRSANNGANWSAITIPSSVFGAYPDSFGHWYYVTSTSGGGGVQCLLYRADTLSGTFSAVFSHWTAMASLIVQHGGGVSIATADYVLYVSTDEGITWRPKTLIKAGAVVLKTGEILAQGVTGKTLRSIDAGETWKESVYDAAQFNTGDMDNVGNWVTRTGTNVYSSTRQYNYDVATQFKTPPRKAAKGYKAYIKGKFL